MTKTALVILALTVSSTVFAGAPTCTSQDGSTTVTFSDDLKTGLVSLAGKPAENGSMDCFTGVVSTNFYCSAIINLDKPDAGYTVAVDRGTKKGQLFSNDPTQIGKGTDLTCDF